MISFVWFLEEGDQTTGSPRSMTEMAKELEGPREDEMEKGGTAKVSEGLRTQICLVCPLEHPTETDQVQGKEKRANDDKNGATLHRGLEPAPGGQLL